MRGFFFLPGSLWWSEYYRHLEAALSQATAARPPFQLEQLELIKAEAYTAGWIQALAGCLFLRQAIELH